MRTATWQLALAGLVGAATVIVGATGPRERAASERAAVPASTAASAAGAALDEGITLGVEGRANATPWIAAEESFVAVVWGVSLGEKRNDVMLAVSRDGGSTFDAPVRVNREPGTARVGGELPPRVVLVPGAAKSATPEIIVLWNAREATTGINVARSRDGGRTFDTPARLQSPGALGDRGWPALAADRRGGAHAIWLDHRGLAAAKSAQGSSAAKTTHAHGAAAASTAATGTTGSKGAAPTTARAGASSGPAPAPAAPAAASHAAMDGTAMAQRSSLYYASVQGSAAPVEQAITSGVCYCCKTSLVVGRQGELFAAWRHVYPGNLRDIAFSASRDGGRTFTPPVRVSEDNWEINGCPDDGPAMVVTNDDALHIVWPTVVGKDDEMRGALFYAASRDGRRFGARQRIPSDSVKPMHPQIATDERGGLVVAWDEFIAGNRRVARIARLRASGRPGDETVSFGTPLTLGGGSAADDAQYPVLASSSRGLLAVWTRGAQASSSIIVRRVSVPTS